MKADSFIDLLIANKISFFTGVPDSLLSPLINCMYAKFNSYEYHVPAVNEGASVGVAAGYHMATGLVPCVYMQNSGIGNAVNPIVSLLSEKVYRIPTLFVVGWRGEPGFKDEPQHVYQGEITERLLACIGLTYKVIDNKTTELQLQEMLDTFSTQWSEGKSCALIVRKDSFENSDPFKFSNSYSIVRENAIKSIISQLPAESVFVSTTGKISRELYEARDSMHASHSQDFLTVGGMGHALSIALGIAVSNRSRKVVCIDGDGAMLMHMGAVATVGAMSPNNLLHIVLDNGSHESVGGMPTSAGNLELERIAQAAGYPEVFVVETESELNDAICKASSKESLAFIRVKVSLESRKDLGRPKTSAWENKQQFMEFLKTKGQIR